MLLHFQGRITIIGMQRLQDKRRKTLIYGLRAQGLLMAFRAISAVSSQL